MKICMDCGEVEMFDVDARKSFEKYGRVYCPKCIENMLNKHLHKCEFNDECDECGNPKNEQSWAQMTGCEGEVDFYLCQTCAVKYLIKIHDDEFLQRRQ